MKQNLDPKKLDASNIGNGVVIRLSDGTEQSAILTDMSPRAARFQWRTGPGPLDWKYTWIFPLHWEEQVLAIFPVGASFLVTSESPVSAAVV